MASLMLSARENHKEISITCPLCKFGSKISVSYLEDAIHDGLEITCCVCEHPFKIVVMPLEVAQSNTGSQPDGAWDCPNCKKPNINQAKACWFCEQPRPAAKA